MGGESYPGMCSIDPANVSGILAVKPMAGRVHRLRGSFPFHFRQGGERGSRNDAGYAAGHESGSQQLHGFHDWPEFNSIATTSAKRLHTFLTPALLRAHQFRLKERSQPPRFIRRRILPWRPDMGPVEVLRAMLMYFVLPLWLAAGFSDYLCHRATHIEKTSGWKESVLHLAQFAEMAVPVLAAFSSKSLRV
ncbi:hypothetical protein [Bradyrhizobium jicamae]|uniref:hypothetical protein n=1 Tax=Bradyrhizobium jicamae TaxID=280332 RepID=UPI001FD978E7|nr:hypothetical protein [Bradyrhizobium jicamae]